MFSIRDFTLLHGTISKESYAEGKDDGIVEGIRVVAHRLLQLGLPLEQITTGTGLTVEQVQELRQQ